MLPLTYLNLAYETAFVYFSNRYKTKIWNSSECHPVSTQIVNKSSCCGWPSSLVIAEIQVGPSMKHSFIAIKGSVYNTPGSN